MAIRQHIIELHPVQRAGRKTGSRGHAAAQTRRAAFFCFHAVLRFLQLKTRVAHLHAGSEAGLQSVFQHLQDFRMQDDFLLQQADPA
jgi:hypothetical protein